MSTEKITNDKTAPGTGSVPQSGEVEVVTPGPARRSGARTQPSPLARAAAGKLIPDEMKAKAVETLNEAMGATRRYWCKTAQAFVEEPDYGTRTKAAELVLAYAEGRPVERQVKLSGDFSSYNDRLTKLIATPEGLRTAIAAGLISEEQARKPESVEREAKSPKTGSAGKSEA